MSTTPKSEASGQQSADAEQQSSGAPEQSGDFVNEGDESYEKGWWGTRETKHPDEAYALPSGPDSPVGEKGAE